jgi:hypothetical protein
MVRISEYHNMIRRILVSLVILMPGFFYVVTARAQEMPPRPVEVGFVQNLNFGAFSLGPTGGTVTISPYGIRTSTGDIILVTLGYLYYPAIFTLEGNPGTIVHFLAGSTAVLTGSNGGFLMLALGASNLGDPIIINTAPPGQMEVRVGGTLIVGTPLANPPGTYSGTFMVMFIQE